MSDTRNQLLLAALQRAGKALSSDQLLDEAVGLALGDGWTSEQAASLNRRSVAKRLQDMQAEGLVKVSGQVIDDASRRTTATYMPLSDYDPRAEIPPAPSGITRAAAKESPYESLDKPQLIALLDGQDDLLECMGRFLGDLARTREKVRSRLHAAGLGDR